MYGGGGASSHEVCYYCTIQGTFLFRPLAMLADITLHFNIGVFMLHKYGNAMAAVKVELQGVVLKALVGL